MWWTCSAKISSNLTILFLHDMVIGTNQLVHEGLILCIHDCDRSPHLCEQGHADSSWLDYRLLHSLPISWHYWHPHRQHHIPNYSSMNVDWRTTFQHQKSNFSHFFQLFLQWMLQCYCLMCVCIIFQANAIACHDNHFIRDYDRIATYAKEDTIFGIPIIMIYGCLRVCFKTKWLLQSKMWSFSI